ncbi:hypothetical protein D4764_01G0000480 [Takifugu flavidus]|uniref:Uncharacterized protein n=1 Tax=Takifugu flavidus TaxID=433684 RepID=A0A5C6PLG1_9TELE|nr:hypothetical protein D4764_01G0000480 [Takifugu flavidus]
MVHPKGKPRTRPGGLLGPILEPGLGLELDGKLICGHMFWTFGAELSTDHYLVGRQLGHTVLGVRGELLSSPGAIIQRWKEYFQELLNPTNTYSQGGTELEDQDVDRPISGAEVAKIVKQLPGGGAPGADEISLGYLKAQGGGPYFQQWGPEGVFELQ